MTDVDAIAMELAKELVQFYKPTVQELTWAIEPVLRERDAEWQAKLDEAEAQAAAMREMLVDLRKVCRGAANYNQQFIHAGHPDVVSWQEYTTKIEAAIFPTAGRALLARVKELEGEVERLQAHIDLCANAGRV